MCPVAAGFMNMEYTRSGYLQPIDGSRICGGKITPKYIGKKDGNIIRLQIHGGRVEEESHFQKNNSGLVSLKPN